MEELMIKIENVKKTYKLGEIGGTTLRDELQRLFAKIRKKEDPTRRIGAKNYNKGEKFNALNGVSFEVKKGEAIGLIGHNGAGKSTLLKLLSRVTAPTEGTISLNGRIASMLEVGTGFHPELTGRENIYMNGAILGMTKKEIDSKIEQIIDFSEVRQFIDTPVKRYSSGMYVKLAFSVASHLDSEIVLMDEVLAVGDMAFQNKCIKKMREIADSGRTIIYVSHNMNTIRNLCDRVIVLNKGQVVFNGDVEEGISKYLGTDNEVLPVSYELSDTYRVYPYYGARLKINKLEFVDKKHPIFSRSEPLKFKITFTAFENLCDLKLYFAIRSFSGGNIGTTQTFSPFLNAEANTKYEVSFSLDISNIVAGKYYFAPSIVSSDNHGNYLVFYDHPEQNIVFKIEDDCPIGIKWNLNYFGHIHLNELKTIDIINNPPR